jgi:uncharacterized protein YggU (UPF0235/DUF167 family)
VAIEGDAIRISVAAPAREGAANAATLRALAEALGIGRSFIRLARGKSSRFKTFVVTGMTRAEVFSRLRSRSNGGV